MQVSLYCDGGSRGNPGVAGSGSVLYGPDGATLAEIAYVVGAKATNNVAEYYGLVRGLEAARDLGATAVDVKMDSKLVVEQMNGRWKIKHPDMKELALQARELARGFDKVTYTWVPRDKNKKADALSNVAMDAAAKDGTPRIVGGGATPAAEKPTKHEVASPAHWSDAKAPRTRFVLLRHGQTAHSAQRRYSGVSDPDLTDTGREQAQRAAATVAAMGAIDAIVTSPQARAMQTAAYCADALGIDKAAIEQVDGLREMDFGDFEGLTRDEARARFGEEFGAWEASLSEPTPNGESLAQLHRRVTRTRLKLQDTYEGKTVLVVTHMTPIKSIVRQALGTGGETFKHIFLDLASLTVVEFYGDHGVLRTFNDVAHHRELPKTPRPA